MCTRALSDALLAFAFVDARRSLPGLAPQPDDRPNDTTPDAPAAMQREALRDTQKEASLIGNTLRMAAPDVTPPVVLIFPRRRGQVDYAARAAVWDLNSNSMGLT